MCQLSCFYHKLSNCYTDRLDNNSCREESGKMIQRRVMAGWAAYTRQWDLFKSSLVISLKR